MTKKHEYTRIELHHLVWTEPITHIATRLNIDPYKIRQQCKVHNIPTPDSGYWSKKKFGKDINPIGLPNPENDSKITLVNTATTEGKLMLNKPTKVQKRKLKVPKKLINPHPFIKRAENGYIGSF